MTGVAFFPDHVGFRMFFNLANADLRQRCFGICCVLDVLFDHALAEILRVALPFLLAFVLVEQIGLVGEGPRVRYWRHRVFARFHLGLELLQPLLRLFERDVEGRANRLAFAAMTKTPRAPFAALADREIKPCAVGVRAVGGMVEEGFGETSGELHGHLVSYSCNLASGARRSGSSLTACQTACQILSENRPKAPTSGGSL